MRSHKPRPKIGDCTAMVRAGRDIELCGAALAGKYPTYD